MINPPPDPYPFVDAGSPVGGEPLRPRALWYWIGAACIVAGLVAAVVLGVRSVVGADDKIDSFPRVDIPGRATIDLEPGTYTLYHEFPGAADDVGRPAPTVIVTDPEGEEVPIGFSLGTQTYAISGNEGISMGELRIWTRGPHEVFVRGEPRFGERVAIGKGVVGDIILGVFAALGLAALGILVGLTILIVTAVRRSSATRRMRLASGGFGTQTYLPPPPHNTGGWGAPSPPHPPGAPGPLGPPGAPGPLGPPGAPGPLGPPGAWPQPPPPPPPGAASAPDGGIPKPPSYPT